MQTPAKKVLVLCTGNSCRSQMAHGYLSKFFGEHAEVFSAGVETHGVNPLAIKVMQEDGVDISHHTSNNISEYSLHQFDVVITVCDHAQERCPVFPNAAKKIHHNFIDPSKATGTEEEIHQSFQQTREEIKEWCSRFAKEYLQGKFRSY